MIWGAETIIWKHIEQSTKKPKARNSSNVENTKENGVVPETRGRRLAEKMERQIRRFRYYGLVPIILLVSMIYVHPSSMSKCNT
jgi:hypothetical protein